MRDLIQGRLVVRELNALGAEQLSEALYGYGSDYYDEDRDLIIDGTDEQPELDSMRGEYGLSSSIMATNHQIHDEVAAVLSGRSRFK